MLPFPFSQPQGKEILTSGAPAIAIGHIQGQAAETGEETPLNITPPPNTHTLLVWMGVKSEQEVEALASLRIQQDWGGGKGIDFRQYAPHQKFFLNLSDVS